MGNGNSRHEVEHNIERLRHYASGAAMIFKNAEALYEEAQLLGQAGHFARATVLHQISMEECSKIDTLGVAATSILVGHNVDEARLARAFRNHKAKNQANAYFARITDEEIAARERKDWKASSEAFKRFQDKFHAEVNAIKNAGLYVDFQDGQFTAPVDSIDEQTAIAFQCVNAYFLKHCDNFLRLLRRMVSEPDFYAELTKSFVERSEALRAAEELDPQQIQDVLMDELLANYGSKMAERKLNDLS
jgi:AbiV family abortive infection protein